MLKVAFPLSMLRQDAKILDADALRFVQQYYLLENLALGLVRDSGRSPTGYEPGLARSWKRTGPASWEFLLTDGARWSDGSAIRPQAVVEHLERLRDGRHRHIVYLRKLKTAGLDGNRLALEFNEPVNEGLIHELSLADSFLVHPKNREGDWSVVSGPYSVASYEIGKRLVLRRNPHFSGEEDYPEEVALFPYTPASFADFFKTVELDLVRVGRPADKATYGDATARAPQALWGYPTVLHYFEFNKASALWRDPAARRAFAALADSALAGVEVDGMPRELQFIPKGFTGRLDRAPRPPAAEANGLKGRALRVSLHESYRNSPEIVGALERGLAEAGIALKLDYDRFTPQEDGAADIRFGMFAGNQKDALGSWKFLFSPDSGPLGAFLPEVSALIDAVAAADDGKRREAALRALHRKAVRDAYAVPLFVEPVLFLASKRVDLSRVNRFDMRMRFHELRWK